MALVNTGKLQYTSEYVSPFGSAIACRSVPGLIPGGGQGTGRAMLTDDVVQLWGQYVVYC